VTQAQNLLVVGVGGQGTLLASNIIAEVGRRAGYDVKKSEVHGMAQRGGSVSSHVRWGDRVYSPLIPLGKADILISLERVEALRYLEYLGPSSKVIVNDHVIVPVTVTTGSASYPARQSILDTIQQVTSDLVIVPGVSIAEELGNARTSNVVLLGSLARHLPVDRSTWEKVIGDIVPARYRELNLKAFARGYAL
jgi:indolepyruvate ferredoxin oxidoreductase beta subunit